MKLMLSILLLILSGCCTAPEDEKPEAPKDSHIIYESQYYMEKNDIETWIEGKWIQTEGELASFGIAPYNEFSFDNIKGKWVKSIFSNNPIGIIESSYKIVEQYWGDNQHFLDTQVSKGLISGELNYIEIEKINEDKIKVYHRGYNLNNLPPDFDWLNPDPKFAVRTLGNTYTIYQRVK